MLCLLCFPSLFLKSLPPVSLYITDYSMWNYCTKFILINSCFSLIQHLEIMFIAYLFLFVLFQSDQLKGSSKFGQHLNKFLTVNTLYTVGPWLESLVSVVMKSERPEEKSAAPFLYTPPLPDISTKPLSTFIQVC